MFCEVQTELSWVNWVMKLVFVRSDVLDGCIGPT